MALQDSPRIIKSSTLLLVEVGDLAILEVKFMHEGLAIKEVVEGLIPNLKKSRPQTEKTSSQI